MPHPSQNSVVTLRSYRPWYLDVYNAAGRRVSHNGASWRQEHITLRGRAASTKNPRGPSGWRKPNAYYGYEISHTPGWCKTRRPDVGGGYRIAESSVDYPWSLSSTSLAFPQSWVDSAYQRALLKFKHRHLNLATTVGELRETRHMLRGTILKVAELAHAIKRPRVFIRTARRDFDLVNLWLQARYGWIPLLSDVKGAVESVAYHMGVKPPSLTVRARNIVHHTTDREFEQAVYSGAIRLTEHTEYDAVVRVRMDADVLDQHTLNLVDTGINDPALVAWELLPYTFVVDWFVSVGKYLDGLNAMAGLSYRGGSTTILLKAKTSLVCRSHNLDGRVLEFTSPTRTFKRFDRKVIGQPVSKLVWNGFDKMDPVHWADAVGLLSQRLRGLRR